MIPAVHKEKTLAIAYDTERIDDPVADFFSYEYWRTQKTLAGTAVGRGNTWYVNAPFGAVVLRQYLRGGWVAGISRAHYLFTTIERSRPFREFFMLASLLDLGLPVPRPVAALCRHRGILSTGALITATIEDAKTLADMLPATGSGSVISQETWAGIGRCIRQFHRAGVWHADLNARNILLNSVKKVYLIDFDRARLTPAKEVDGKSNLARLRRSLTKLWPDSHDQTLQAAWEQLMAGYDD